MLNKIENLNRKVEKLTLEVKRLNRQVERFERMKRHQKMHKEALKNGAVCCHCEIKLTKKNISVEHLVPLSQGGTDDPKNLDFACRKCNNKRGDTPLGEFRSSPHILRKRLCMQVDRMSHDGKRYIRALKSMYKAYVRQESNIKSFKINVSFYRNKLTEEDTSAIKKFWHIKRIQKRMGLLQ